MKLTTDHHIHKPERFAVMVQQIDWNNKNRTAYGGKTSPGLIMGWLCKCGRFEASDLMEKSKIQELIDAGRLPKPLLYKPKEAIPAIPAQ